MEAIEALNYAIFALNTLEEPQASARSDIEELDARHEEIVGALSTLRQAIRDRDGIDAPELTVARDDEGEFLGLKCPHCEKVVDVTEIDVDERWNTAEPAVDGEGWLSLDYHRGDCNYVHLRYQCASCHGTVALPAEFTDKVAEEWS